MMKRLMKCLALALLLLPGVPATAQTSVKGLMKTYSKMEGAEYTHLSKMVMAMVKAMAKGEKLDKTERSVVKALRSIRVLNLEECSEQVKQQFREDAKQLNTSMYERLIEHREEGEETTILVRMRGEKVKELVVLTYDWGDCQLVSLKCNARMDDIKQLLESGDGVLNI